ncbi:hypothetical protein PGT21_006002 [Puccinia graminis f. sp. tritici]|uniref:C2H2-type domain-containing protein n=1 Tax=Puccinia graminis f. sp. tritici TaxID=56615 RepID=A0A5B0MF01_PUCGR|nr:hypothetical protein PGT21_006002 [Puccinia graminis f. sp. tritici]
MAQAQFARDVRQLANLLGLAPEAQQAPLASTSAHQRPGFDNLNRTEPVFEGLHLSSLDYDPTSLISDIQCGTGNPGINQTRPPPTVFISQPQSSPGPQPFEVAQQYYHHNSTQSAPLPVSGPSTSSSQPAQWPSTLAPMLQHFTASNETFVQPGQQAKDYRQHGNLPTTSTFSIGQPRGQSLLSSQPQGFFFSHALVVAAYSNSMGSALPVAGPSTNLPEPTPWTRASPPTLDDAGADATLMHPGQKYSSYQTMTEPPVAGPSSTVIRSENGQQARGHKVSKTRLTPKERKAIILECPYPRCQYQVSLDRASNMRNHMISHRNAKSFECQLCSPRHAYCRENELKSHVESAGAGKLFGGRVQYQKNVHSRVKLEGELMNELKTFEWKCTLCHCMYASVDQLKDHVVRHHGKPRSTVQQYIHARTQEQRRLEAESFREALEYSAQVEYQINEHSTRNKRKQA